MSVAKITDTIRGFLADDFFTRKAAFAIEFTPDDWRTIERLLKSARPEAPLNEAERLSKKWLAAHPHAMMVVEHAGAMLRDALHPTAPSAPSPLARKCRHGYREENCGLCHPELEPKETPQSGA